MDKTLLFNMRSKKELSILRINGECLYLEGDGLKRGYCDVCGKKKKTTGHHLVPKRLGCRFKELSKLKIRICESCNEGMHPENALIKVDPIIKKLNKKMKQLYGEVSFYRTKFENIKRQVAFILEEGESKVYN